MEEYICEQCGKHIPASNKQRIPINGKTVTLCGKHYAQWRKHGKFLDSNPRSCFDYNEFEETEEGVWVQCFNRRNEVSGRFLIDHEDFDAVAQRKWRFWKGRFFTGSHKPISISQFLMQAEDGQVIDHINGDPADNRRSNLRIVTQSENMRNKALLSNNSSGIAGVSWDKARKCWAPQIGMRHKRCHLGRYKNLADAVFVRYIAEIGLFGEYRSTRNEALIQSYIDQCERKTELSIYVIDKLASKFTPVDFASQCGHTDRGC